MKLNDFIAAMEAIAPKELACPWDNPGLLIGTEKIEISKVLVALDCSVQTAKEAIEWGADLLLTHHPVFFGGVKRIAPDDPDTAGAYMLIRHGIGLFAAHTNLDSAEGGVNDCLAEELGLQSIEKLPPDEMGRIGLLPAAMPFIDFARMVEQKLCTRVRITGADDTPVQRIALVGGSAADELFAAKAAGADAFITGEMKHHFAIQAGALGLCIVEAGHYETEKVVLQPLISRLQAITNDVQYRLTRSESACLRGI